MDEGITGIAEDQAQAALAPGRLPAARWLDLKAKSEASYKVQIDLRELGALCDAALQLTWLREAVREAAQWITIEDEKMRLLGLLKHVTACIEGSIE